MPKNTGTGVSDGEMSVSTNKITQLQL